MGYDYYKEKMEAIQAGETALNYLYAAKDDLDSARGWGIFDILGGGFLSTAIKHGKLDSAKNNIRHAQNAVRRFSNELNDLNGYGEISLGIGGLGTFVDFFADGFLADMYIQSKINNARNKIDELIYNVEGILQRLND